MHSVEEVSPHEAVPSTAIDIEPGAAGDHHAEFLPIGMNIEKTLEEGLPTAIFVDLIEDYLGATGASFVGSDGCGHGRRSLLNQTPVVGRVPVEIVLRAMPANSGLAHLPRTADEGHLPMNLQMSLQDGIIDSATIVH
jgi:hypothetical protein